MHAQTYDIPSLPIQSELETFRVLKALSKAHRYLAEVKGRASSIPNQGILIDTLSLQEAKESSEIENIVTTNDELFRREFERDTKLLGPAKEVAQYRDALRAGFLQLHKTGLISNSAIVEMFQILKGRTDGFRSQFGTVLQNSAGEIVHVPPQHPNDVIQFMAELEAYINTAPDEADDLDPLIKMAIIHHQFESIHPFPDGNGRVGRMLNVLYLTKEGLLEIPILYFSRGINQSKSEYYRLLQDVRERGSWEDWVVYNLEIITVTSQVTLRMIDGIRHQMSGFKKTIREKHPKIYSQDLINNLFRHPYTRIDYIIEDVGVSRPTATKILNTLAEDPDLPVIKLKEGRNHYYVNSALVSLLTEFEEPKK